MPEAVQLVATRAAVVGCFASSAALDALEVAGTFLCRVAPDEAMLVGEAGTGEGILEAAAARLAAADDDDAVVLDATDGWSVWTLAGERRHEAFAYLSELDVPQGGFAAGDVAHVPVRVIAAGEHLHLFVPAMWNAYLRERVLARCAPADISESAEPKEWSA